MAFEPITTQEQFDAAIAKRLEKATKAVEDKFKDYDSLKTSNEDLQKQLDTANETIKSKGAEIDGYKAKVGILESSALKTKIALEKKLPYEFADRLSGEDEAALRADADKWAGYFSQNREVPPLGGTETPPKDGTRESLKGVLKGIRE